MLKHASHLITKSDIFEVAKVLKSNFLTQGPEVKKLEKSITKFTGASYASVMNSSTSSLFLSCLALGLKKNDYVWTSPITFVASANCALYCGAKIDLVDISLKDYNIDIDKLKDKLSKTKKNKIPKIIIAVHFAGNSCDMKSLNLLSKKYKFKVVEDACHAFGGYYENKKIGSCKYSDISTFSFHAIKNIAAGEGGAITTNKINIKRKIDLLRSHGIVRSKDKIGWNYDQKHLGFNFRLTDFQSSLANNQIRRIKKSLKFKKNIAMIYFKYLNKKKIILPKINNKSGLHLFVIRIKNFSIKKKKKLTELLKKKYKILVNFHYIPIYRQSYYKKNFLFNKKNFNNSEIYTNTALSLPFHLSLTKKNCIYISKSINTLVNDFNK